MRISSISLLLLLVLLYLSACSLDYSQVSVTDEISEQIPDSLLRDFSYTVVENGTPAYRLEADQAEFFTEKKITYVKGLIFREYDSLEQLVTEGRSDAAVFFTDSENAELEGNLRFYSSAEEASVETDYLFWNNDEKLLTGSDDGQVRILEDSGSRLDGIGFEADVRRRLVDFTGPVSGLYIADDDE